MLVFFLLTLFFFIITIFYFLRIFSSKQPIFELGSNLAVSFNWQEDRFLGDFIVVDIYLLDLDLCFLSPFKDILFTFSILLSLFPLLFLLLCLLSCVNIVLSVKFVIVVLVVFYSRWSSRRLLHAETAYNLSNSLITKMPITFFSEFNNPMFRLNSILDRRASSNG